MDREREGSPALALGRARQERDGGRVTGHLVWADPFALTLELELGDPDQVNVAQATLERWLGRAEGDDFAPSADWGGERALLARGTFSRPSPASLRLQTTWEPSEVDRACRSLATWIERRARLSNPSAAPGASERP